MRLSEDRMPWIKYIVGYTDSGAAIYRDDMPKDIQSQLESFENRMKFSKIMPVFKTMVELGEDPTTLLSKREIEWCIRNLKVRADKKHIYDEWIKNNKL